MNNRRPTHDTQTQQSVVSLQEDDFLNSSESDNNRKDISVEDLDSSSSQNTKLL